MSALVLAACGSQLDPGTVAQVNGESGQAGSASGEFPTSGDSPAGTLPGGSAAGSGGGSGSTGDAGSGGSGDTSGSGDGPPAVSGQQGSCAGFKNGPGITDDTITIGNAADVSGPIPGLFESSQEATKAFVAYFNATSEICGRKLELNTYDSRTDAGGDQQAYTAACDEVFAMVGSMSAFDHGGAGTAQSCGLPDVRALAATSARNDCSTCFSSFASDVNEVSNDYPTFIKAHYASSADKVALLYMNAGAAVEIADNAVAAFTKQGLDIIYDQGIDVTEFNYSPYVQQLKDKGVEVVLFLGAWQQSVKMAQTMQQMGYQPKLYLRDAGDYTAPYAEQGGDAVEGTTVALSFTPFEEASSNPELSLYMSWLQQVKPGASPSFFGVYSWSAARLFVETAAKLGGKLTRATLLDALSKVDNWTSQGLTAPQHVGSKRTAGCMRYLQLEGGNWKPYGGTKYICSGTTRVG
ncbi:ABC-type branched-subunit amino acid transport system substrate-binding protein [Nocardioides ginsengisegetis]|uniref:ABC-type branched-subunit amino acid transport system substrate-binding protein n=1 Tax=Nocardioides ginsengisegetis TaxID=661491 RepID=A0A7W3PAS5_9ACTN|nr:ABC-type branched-subunit amino acid transport system substrate-binding protein [Nocardioides ginsengisegetis]